MNDVKLFFSISQGTLPWQPIFFLGGIDLQYTNTHRVVHMTFATAAQHTTRRAVAMQVAGKQIT